MDFISCHPAKHTRTPYNTTYNVPQIGLFNEEIEKYYAYNLIVCV